VELTAILKSASQEPQQSNANNDYDQCKGAQHIYPALRSIVQENKLVFLAFAFVRRQPGYFLRILFHLLLLFISCKKPEPGPGRETFTVISGRVQIANCRAYQCICLRSGYSYLLFALCHSVTRHHTSPHFYLRDEPSPTGNIDRTSPQAVIFWQFLMFAPPATLP